MKTDHRFPHDLRAGLIAALPEETSEYGEEPLLSLTYLPASHAKALHPNNTLIEGMRGSGKSFWFMALQNAELRAQIGTQAGLDANTQVTVGFGQKPGRSQFPDKDTLILLMKQKCQPRRIWHAVVYRQVLGDRAPQDFQMLNNWAARIEWIQNHPEQVDENLYDADKRLDNSKQHHIVLFDALDRTADDWPSMNALVKGLLQVVLDTRSYSRIRLKVFARPDQLEDPSVANFPDASKVMNRKVTLAWPRSELYGLLWQYLANNQEYGQRFREGASSVLPNLEWIPTGDVWAVPEVIRHDEDAQKQLFHAMTGPWMGRDKRRGFPYSWLPGHLGDARGEVSPRSFLSAMKFAACDTPRPNQDYLLHYENIKKGVQGASKIRVRELEEDYPWIKVLFDPLSGITVPCPFDDIRVVWQREKVIEKIRNGIDAATVRLPPIHINDAEDGVLLDLLDLGLVERLKDGRINLPDVYRVGYGMGRRGGVKPYSA